METSVKHGIWFRAFCVALGLPLVAVSAARADSIWAGEVVEILAHDGGSYLENYAGVNTDTDPGLLNNLLDASDDAELGWRKATKSSGFVVKFAKDLLDGDGADLKVRDYGPGVYEVWISPDNAAYEKVYDSVAGQQGVFVEYDIDFGGHSNIEYVKVVRTNFEPKNGRFFDSFEGLHPVPEPASMVLLACGCVGLLVRRRSGNG